MPLKDHYKGVKDFPERVRVKSLRLESAKGQVTSIENGRIRVKLTRREKEARALLTLLVRSNRAATHTNILKAREKYPANNMPISRDFANSRNL